MSDSNVCFSRQLPGETHVREPTLHCVGIVIKLSCLLFSLYLVCFLLGVPVTRSRGGQRLMINEPLALVRSCCVYGGCDGCLLDPGARAIRRLAFKRNQRSAEAYRTTNGIEVNRECPEPLETFDIAAPMLGNNLCKAMRAQGYTAPSPIQAQVWPIALEGRDMVAVASTGSGKTCGFLLPALARIGERRKVRTNHESAMFELRSIYDSSELDLGGPSSSQNLPVRPNVLIIAPTRELVKQIAVEANKFAPAVGARVVSIYGGASRANQMSELMQGVDILIAVPGRLHDFVTPSEGYADPVLSLESVTYLVFDEADRMLEEGFGTVINKMVRKCQPTGWPEQGGGASGPRANSKRQTLLFTATWPAAVKSMAAKYTSDQAVQVRIRQTGDMLTVNSDIIQEVSVIETRQAKLARLEQLLLTELKPTESAIVFTTLKKTCDLIERKLWHTLNEKGIQLGVIHSDKEQLERDQTLKTFRAISKGGYGRGVLVATNVAARGLDIAGVGMVVIFDYNPKAGGGVSRGADMYVHRVGRTGRAGKTGRAFTFVSSKDKQIPELVKILRESKQAIPRELINLAEGEQYDRRQAQASQNS